MKQGRSEYEKGIISSAWYGHGRIHTLQLEVVCNGTEPHQHQYCTASAWEFMKNLKEWAPASKNILWSAQRVPFLVHQRKTRWFRPKRIAQRIGCHCRLLPSSLASWASSIASCTSRNFAIACGGQLQKSRQATEKIEGTDWFGEKNTCSHTPRPSIVSRTALEQNACWSKIFTTAPTAEKRETYHVSYRWPILSTPTLQEQPHPPKS